MTWVLAVVLVGAGAIGSLIVLNDPLPWESTNAFRGPAGPMVIVLLVGAVLSEFIAMKVLTMTVPRPSYARAGNVSSPAPAPPLPRCRRYR